VSEMALPRLARLMGERSRDRLLKIRIGVETR